MNESTLVQTLPGSNTADARKTTQYLMPQRIDTSVSKSARYNIYPACSLQTGSIQNGYEGLAEWIAGQKTVIIDGYVGVFWKQIQAALQSCLQNKGLKVNWVDAATLLKPASVIDEMVAPFMGTYESVWGTRCTLTLADYFDQSAAEMHSPDAKADINIIIGTGAALAGWDGALVYFDLPKNELQFRMRAESITNLGSERTYEPFYMYKRFYFVDWVLLNEHKKNILNKIDVIADGQWPDSVNWMAGDTLRIGLSTLTTMPLRVRPWFEPGAWGGQWIKSNIEGVNPDAVNYAWSFELIVPENGLVFESDGWLLEVSFDMLMFQNGKDVLGSHAEVFGDEFPIRFDFLDTVKGGNLSIQCHPSLKYIRENFGERITQDETYYILDCDPDAQVYLGFQDSINPEEFKSALESSQAESKPLDMESYVQVHSAQKHDLFLIPNGTVHSAGAGNLVLEISATPYIFTFKMYDWLRLDLEGNPRPININHAFNNLDFTRKGQRVQEELISKPAVLSQTDDVRVIHLPTHSQHFYDVHRLEFANEAYVELNGGCHVLMVVEGESVTVKTPGSADQTFAYAETFVVPAAAGSYTLTNSGSTPLKVIKAFLK
ncbi:class I mannose-6-phosphate isomerase [uncultured Mucilaginibacter sp.]|uniref:class I mannose-6-phosphate isomerase n=1 Tax=uncultured Mucilaginibacter sp. TaxID=797541 RepID=UPI0025FF3059|nr:class I mannose-6-phosphate isomerase [uncultured Mucilaginibacter sp.]